MVDLSHLSDEELLLRSKEDDEAFAVFYRRYERPVVQFFVRAVRSGDLASDLAAEVFATVVASTDKFDRNRGTASAWLFGISRNLLARSRELGRVEDRARRRLGLPVLALDDDTIAHVESSDQGRRALELLESLPEAQRQAVIARVVEEREYSDIARQLQCSELVVRKRLSRGLSILRQQLEQRCS